MKQKLVVYYCACCKKKQTFELNYKVSSRVCRCSKCNSANLCAELGVQQ